MKRGLADLAETILLDGWGNHAVHLDYRQDRVLLSAYGLGGASRFSWGVSANWSGGVGGVLLTNVDNFTSNGLLHKFVARAWAAAGKISEGLGGSENAHIYLVTRTAGLEDARGADPTVTMQRFAGREPQDEDLDSMARELRRAGRDVGATEE